MQDPQTSPPKYIVIEGIDGTGKSTLATGIAKFLTAHGRVIRTEEPTRGPTGQAIRRLLGSHSREVSVREWLELFETDRAHHMETVVKPALDRGDWVIQDRSFYSTAAYQGSQGVSPDDILARNRAFAVEPGLVLILDLDPAISLKRTQARLGMEAEVFEREEFLTLVADAFKSFKGPNIRRIDASKSAGQVLNDALAHIRLHFGLK